MGAEKNTQHVERTAKTSSYSCELRNVVNKFTRYDRLFHQNTKSLLLKKETKTPIGKSGRSTFIDGLGTGEILLYYSKQISRYCPIFSEIFHISETACIANSNIYVNFIFI